MIREASCIPHPQQSASVSYLPAPPTPVGRRPHFWGIFPVLSPQSHIGFPPGITPLSKAFDSVNSPQRVACRSLLMVRLHPAWQPWISGGNDVELGAHIKRYRTERGMSQEDLAARIYVSRQTVSNWETDKTYPDVESLLLLSVLFDTTIDELIKGDVEAMKDVLKNDAKKMNVYATAGLTIAIVGAIAAVCGIMFWGWGVVPSIIIGLLVWGIGMYLLIKVERMKKEHNLVTYREIDAFMKGEPIDRDNPKSRRARKHRFLKGAVLVLVAACVGAVAGYVSFMFFG